MALQKFGADYAYGISTGVGTETEATGIDSVTSSELSASYETNVTAKDSAGEVAAHLLGNSKKTMRVEGFAAAAELPALGTAIKVSGEEGRVISSSVTASNEDFVKVSASGEGYDGIVYTP